jgi:hypothetical protein
MDSWTNTNHHYPTPDADSPLWVIVDYGENEVAMHGPYSRERAMDLLAWVEAFGISARIGFQADGSPRMNSTTMKLAGRT